MDPIEISDDESAPIVVIEDSDDEHEKGDGGASYAKAVSTATSFVAATSNDDGGDSHSSGGSGDSHGDDPDFNSHDHAESDSHSDSNSGDASSTPSTQQKSKAPYRCWDIQDTVQLLKAVGELHKSYREARVPRSILLDEFFKAGKLIRPGKVTSRNITDKIKYSRKIFVQMCKEERTRKFRQVRTWTEEKFFQCCKEVWPELVEQARGQLEKSSRRTRATKKI
ncbi:hypothetical protein ZWY2020_014188 [Hordeum vulgare]|nr:hypothetical protein ZWY2020_014188 [Hordeum vulgare]